MTIPNIAWKHNGTGQWDRQMAILAIAGLLLAVSIGFLLGILVQRAMPDAQGQGTITLGSAALSTSLPADAIAAEKSTLATPIPAGGQVVASKTGKVYYLPWCSGVNRIKSVNRVYYNSAADAKAQGLTPAKGCAGL